MLMHTVIVIGVHTSKFGVTVPAQVSEVNRKRPRLFRIASTTLPNIALQILTEQVLGVCTVFLK
jgi:hypothetical protein